MVLELLFSCSCFFIFFSFILASVCFGSADHEICPGNSWIIWSLQPDLPCISCLCLQTFAPALCYSLFIMWEQKEEEKWKLFQWLQINMNHFVFTHVCRMEGQARKEKTGANSDGVLPASSIRHHFGSIKEGKESTWATSETVYQKEREWTLKTVKTDKTIHKAAEQEENVEAPCVSKKAIQAAERLGGITNSISHHLLWESAGGSTAEMLF